MQKITKKIISLKKIITPKEFIKKWIAGLLLFIAYHALVWFFFTSRLLGVDVPLQVGDLARIGYCPQSIHLRERTIDLPKTHLEFSEWQRESIDIMTLGDSFSNGGASGQNPYYQDYLASRNGYNVLNINPSLFGENYIEAIVALLNSGALDTIKPKAIMLESIERSTVGRFAQSINWDRNESQKALIDDLKNGKWGDAKLSKDKQVFITTANYKLPLYNLFYLFSPNAFGYSGLYKLKLDSSLFSVKDDSTLLAYKQDITSIFGMTPKNITLMNDNFNHLADLLAAKGMRLIVMPAVDKYDLYYDHISHNPYNRNPFFDLLRPMEKRYTFIDTKAMLSVELKKGRKNIFYADDTHWSNLASEAITSNEEMKLLLQ